MLLGYNTNGFPHHDPLQALELLAEIGYRSVALSIDHGLLNPYSPQFADQLRTVRQTLTRLDLRSVVETGARYLLDPRLKHEPTLVSASAAGRARRVEFLCRAIDIARELGSDCVSAFSGAVHDGADDDAVWERLLAGLNEVLAYAFDRQVIVAFEPEPGMFIDAMRRYAELTERLERSGPSSLRLTLDIGHLHCLGETPLAEQIVTWGGRLANVHLEDMRSGVHEHLMFGEGEIEFPPVFAALRQIGYRGGVHVELSRHGHDAPRVAEAAFRFLQPLASQS